jgi:glycosyltransferase involved in cell wall biosynthesis
MPTNKTEKFAGAISIASNSPGAPTGYGVQSQYLVERLLKHGFKVAALSNYGLEGKIETVQAKTGKYTHYPKGFKPYGDDAIPVWHGQHKEQNPGLKDALITLYDVWVYNDLKFDGDIFAWTPLDHVTLPPNVLKFLLRDNVTPLTMSPHGKRQLDKAGIDNVYIPHGIDTKVMKPTKEIFGMPTREYLDVPEDGFLVGIFAANKANGLIHRKAFAENLFAFAKFREEHPDAYLYIHAEPSNAFGGFQLVNLIRAVGLDDTCVRILNTDVNRTGYPVEAVAAFMSACDVVLSTSYGEGFGVPQVEAQACGTRVITSSWAASPDLAGEDSFLVAGQPFWDEPQQSFYNIPHIPSIIEALREAYKMPRGTSLVSVDFAKQFDVDLVWNWYWLPFLRDRFYSAA